MFMLKIIVSQIRSENWFVMIDLKDAYFHIKIRPEHRMFLRFTFRDEAYLYRVFPFALALSSQTYTMCMDAALAPLWLQGSSRGCGHHKADASLWFCCGSWWLPHTWEGLQLSWKQLSGNKDCISSCWNTFPLLKGFSFVGLHGQPVTKAVSVHAPSFFRLAQQILLWAESKLLYLRAIYNPGHENHEAEKAVSGARKRYLYSLVVEAILQSSSQVGQYGTDKAKALFVYFSPDSSSPSSPSQSVPGPNPPIASDSTLACWCLLRRFLSRRIFFHRSWWPLFILSHKCGTFGSGPWGGPDQKFWSFYQCSGDRWKSNSLLALPQLGNYNLETLIMVQAIPPGPSPRLHWFSAGVLTLFCYRYFLFHTWTSEGPKSCRTDLGSPAPSSCLCQFTWPSGTNTLYCVAALVLMFP